MYKQILVVVDDRVVTQSAIRQAIEMAHALRADLHFFYVLPNHVDLGFDIHPAEALSAASVPVLVCRDTGSSGGFGRRASVAIRARQRRLELMERRSKERND